MAEIRVNATGALKLYDNDDSHFVGLQAGSVSSNVTFTLPTADGSNGQFLKTDGSGALSFGSVSSSGAYDLNGGELVLDADADTSITADTDDQIDIRIAGADDFTFTANSFNVLSGSEIDLADNCELRIGDSDDLKLFHQGSHSVIAHGGTGDLQIRATDSGKNFIIYDHDASNEWFKLDASGNAVFNEGSADVDFRVESNGNTHMLFVDGGSDQVKIGADTGVGELNVTGSGTVTMANNFYNDTHADIASNPCIEIKNSDTTDNNFSSILFIDSGGFANGGIHCVNIDHDTSGGGELVFTTRNDDQNSDTITNCGRFNNIGDFMVGSSNNSPSDTKGSYMDYSGELVAHVDTSNNGPTLFAGFSSAGGTQEMKFQVTADGSVNSRNNNFGAFSDERLKKDIVDANSQWNDVKAFKFKNFKLKSIDGTDNEKQLGVIAQDLESVSPKLIIEVDPTVPDILLSSEFGEVEDDLDRPKIYDNPENLPSGKNIGDPMLDGSGNQLYKKKIKSTTGKKVKQVKYSVLYMKAIKALQEAQTRIETLETKVAALEG